MRKQKRVALGFLALTSLGIAAICGYYYWSVWNRGANNSAVLAYLPVDPAAVFYVDLAALRQSAFWGQLAAWAPRPERDPEYAQFLEETGFDFERDLDRAAIATQKTGTFSSLVFIAEGKFDRERISAYAVRTGRQQHESGREVFRVPLGAGKGGLAFSFISDGLLFLTDGNELSEILADAGKKSEQRTEWRQRFERLAGSPAFAVIRQDAGTAIAEHAPGGFRSPQLSALLDELQWITIAAKPDGDQLRVVAEGESATETTSRQLADLLNGVILLARAGLNDPKMRRQLDPAVRQAYLELLESADVRKVDRGETKAVRLIAWVTPKLVDAARASRPLAVPGPADKAPGRKTPSTSPKKSGT
jgi:hypothetical protein